MPPGVMVGSTSIPMSHYADVAEHLFSLSPHETGAVSTPGIDYPLQNGDLVGPL